jgi:hypothetical protein
VGRSGAGRCERKGRAGKRGGRKSAHRLIVPDRGTYTPQP